jgi:hypothetical protein
MNVYIDNMLKRATSLSVSNADPSYQASSLYDVILSNNLLCTGPSTEITAAWGPNVFADSIALLDCNWTIGHVTVVSQGETEYDSEIVSRGKNTIVKLPRLVMITALTLSLETEAGKTDPQAAADPLSVGILWVGVKTELPLFQTGFKYKPNILSKADRTRYGIVYGVKRTALKSFEINFTGLDNRKRLILEDYIETVQFTEPHLVEPYEAGEFPPVYATLDDGGGFTKQKNGFTWDGFSLSYMEAK